MRKVGIIGSGVSIPIRQVSWYLLYNYPGHLRNPIRKYNASFRYDLMSTSILVKFFFTDYPELHGRIVSDG